MEPIHVTVTFTSIPPGDLAEFKLLAAEALEIAKGEDATMWYSWFFNDDETVCVAQESYRDSDAVLAHLGNVGELLGKLVEAGGGIKLEVFGNPSAQLREATAALEPSVYSFFQGK